MFKTGDKLICIQLGLFFTTGVVYTCKQPFSYGILICGFEEFGVFEEKRFILATELNKALS